MAVEKDFNWEDDLMTKSFQRQSSHLSKLADQYGPDYGKPVPGSDSERRSLEYQQNVVDEVSSLCYQIAQFGFKSKDGSECIKFGDLFKLNEKISNKCVGILQRARKRRLLHFPGETLWQGKDDNVIITLLRRNREIQIYYTHTKKLLPNEPTGNTWITVENQRRVHHEWVLNIKEVDDNILEYNVQINFAEFDDFQELPQRCFPLNKDEDMRKGIPSVEPSVIFKLRPPVIPVLPLVACLAQEYFQPCLPGEVGIIEAFSYCRSCVKEPEPDCLNKAEISSPEIKNCVRDITPPPVIKERWVRSPPPPPYLRRASAIPPPPRTPKPIRRQSISLPTKQLTVLDIPTVFRPERSRTNHENPRTKIKFSTSTALYKPPDPVYEGVKTRRKPAF